jgi:hypothetical protein
VDTVSHAVEVTAPVQIPTITKEISGCAVSFGTELQGSPPFSYNWTFGDGMGDTVAAPTHVYETSDVYSGTLVVSNCAGKGYDEQPFVVTVDCALDEHHIYRPLVLRGGWQEAICLNHQLSRTQGYAGCSCSLCACGTKTWGKVAKSGAAK